MTKKEDVARAIVLSTVKRDCTLSEDDVAQLEKIVLKSLESKVEEIDEGDGNGGGIQPQGAEIFGGYGGGRSRKVTNIFLNLPKLALLITSAVATASESKLLFFTAIIPLLMQIYEMSEVQLTSYEGMVLAVLARHGLNVPVDREALLTEINKETSGSKFEIIPEAAFKATLESLGSKGCVKAFDNNQVQLIERVKQVG